MKQAQLRPVIAAVAATAAVVVLLLGTSAVAAGAQMPGDGAGSHLDGERTGSFAILAEAADSQSSSQSTGRREPAIILGPLPDDVASEQPDREAAPIPRHKPERTQVSPPKPPPQTTPARRAPQHQAPRRQAPARAATPVPQHAKDCDYCKPCEGSSRMCARRWMCANLYREALAAGLCRR